MPVNPYQPPESEPQPGRDPQWMLSAAAIVSWGLLCTALVVSFDPPPQPRYSGSWHPSSVVGLAIVFYDTVGLLLSLVLGLVSMTLAWAARRRCWGLLVWLNLATWLAAYASIPLWNRLFRMPE